ncbi:MAG: energy-coupling factor transporter transmembrane protein EcfT [Lactobacillaceae bacterium]|jgi:energy-coupling factor transport system permease protein|nr:energy-coupling factor transporter transmembrane protein EcfT [Lactobacillaceae bacterium]
MLNKLKINVTAMFILMFVIGVEISFIKSVWLNLIIAGIGLLYVLIYSSHHKIIAWALLISLPIALGTWWSFWAFSVSDNWHLAWVYTTRLYAYFFLGAMLTMTTHVKTLLISLHLHLHLSNTFTYGLLAAFNLLPRVKQQVKIIQYAAQLRGIQYHLWSPQLYFKAIVSSLHWSQDLSEAMTSHGFSEGFPRTESHVDVLPLWQIGLVVILGLSVLVSAIGLNPW